MSCGKECEKTFKRVTHVIFDVDGTLLDTENFYAKAYTETCATYEKEYTEEMKAAITGCPTEIACQKVMEMAGIEAPLEDFMTKYIDLGNSLIADCQLMPGVDDLVKHLHNSNIPLAIATSSMEEQFNLKFSNHQDLLGLFHHFVLTADPEVKNGKPAGDIYLVAAKRFEDNPQPERCLVLEDSVNGVKAARAARMQCIMIPTVEVPPDFEEPTTILKSMTDVKPELFGLPPR